MADESTVTADTCPRCGVLSELTTAGGAWLCCNGHQWVAGGQVEAASDPIEHPPHYCQGGIECIDAIESALGRDGFIAYLRGQIIRYTWRMMHKGNTAEDAAKAAWYCRRLVKVLGVLGEGK